jgi:hypothetical protein
MASDICLISLSEKSKGDNNTVEIDPSSYIDLNQLSIETQNGPVVLNNQPTTADLISKLVLDQNVISLYLQI